MKKRFSQSDGDSLELLLDTLCNVFGGVVLIACLLAIIPRASLPPPLLPVEMATSEMTERRISTAKSEIKQLDAKINELSQAIDPSKSELLARRESLRRTLAEVKSQRQEMDDQKITEAEARATVAQVNPNDLQRKLDQIQTQVLRMENLVKSEDQKIQFLEERLKQLSDESAVLGKAKVQAVRFPRERTKNASPFPIIVRHGQVYPLVIGKSLANNDALIRSKTSDEGAIRVEPIKGKGMTLPESHSTLSTTLKAAAAEKTYISIYLYSDSFGAFQDLKNAIIDAKISYGLEFMENESSLIFSSEGSAPPEL
jgi:hypothetical protein